MVIICLVFCPLVVFDTSFLRTFISWNRFDFCFRRFSLYAGPALGIGRECDGLGPMPLGGPKKILWCRVYIEILSFWRVYIVNFTKRPEILTR